MYEVSTSECILNMLKNDYAEQIYTICNIYNINK